MATTTSSSPPPGGTTFDAELAGLDALELAVDP
jgi:hypothetical protein